jgi:hypothetical protein
MNLKKTIAILISIIFISSSVIANAQTTTSTSAKFTFLNEGDVAPFTGTLFSIEATAKILAEKARAEQECKLKVKYETDTLQAKCARDSDLLSSELEIEKKKYNIIVSAQDEEIARLQKLALDTGEYDILWFSGGVALGIATSIAIFFAAAEIVKK